MERRAGIGRGRLGVAARAPPQLQPETREMQAQSIEQITQGLQNATVGGRYRPSARVPRPAQREEGSTDSGHYSGPPSSDPPSPEHQSLQARVRAEVKTKEQKRMEDDLFDQGQHLQPAMKQKIEEGKFYGTSGTEVMLSSNFYRVDMRNMMRDERGRDVSWYQYRVDFKPAVDDVQKREELIDYIAENNADIFPPLYIFEGTMIFAFSSMDEKKSKFNVTHKDKTIEVSLTLSNTFVPNNPLGVQVMNLINRKNVKDNLQLEQVQRSFFIKDRAIQVYSGGKTFEVWPGYSFAINTYEAGLFMVANIRAKVIPNYTVMDVLKATFQEAAEAVRSKPHLRNIGHGEIFRKESTKRIIGIQVRTHYNNKTYRIDDIAWDLSPQSEVRKADGKLFNFMDFFQDQYQIQIEEAVQPLLINRPKKRQQRRAVGADTNYLLPELCNLTGLDERTRKDFRVMRDLAVHTRKSPQMRSNELRKLIKYMKGKSQPKGRGSMDTAESAAYMDRWGMMIGNSDQNPENEEELFQVRGRELPPEELIMKCRGTGVLKTLQGSKEGDWDRTIKDWHMIETGALENWGFVCTRRDQKRGAQFFSHLKDQAAKIGFRIEEPLVNVAETDRKDDINNAIANIFQNHYHNGVNTEMIFVLLPSRKADVYANVKLACMKRDRPVMSQCLLTSTIMADDKIAAVAFKVAMQMSCKLGGIPWQVKINLKNTMIIGIDTYHDTDRKGKNLTGFVSSYNKNATKWYSQTVQMCSKQEISDGLTHMMEGALEAWKYYNNNQLPDRIIIYRDGVGDGQLSYIHDHELPQIQTKINEYIGEGYDHEPQLLYIVLKKQINQRFFRMNENNEEDNPYPGTVVDSKITRRDMYDFLLVSQKVRQGTVTPVHYNVIFDSTLNLNADKIQMISYKLTHLYFNWPGTIRVPAPCQYAHKLATLIGDHIHTEITDVEFASKPFYL